MAELTPEEQQAIQEWWDSSTPEEKKETIELYHDMWKTVNAAEGSEAEWSAKSIEQKLETVEGFILLIVGLLVGPLAVGIVPAIGAVNELQKWYFTSSAGEQSAERLWTWLDKRKSLSDNQRKIAFIIWLWIGPGQPAPAAHGMLGETVGRGFDNFDVPWEDFLSIWGWGPDSAYDDVNLDPHAFVPFEWAPDVQSGPPKAATPLLLLGGLAALAYFVS